MITQGRNELITNEILTVESEIHKVELAEDYTNIYYVSDGVIKSENILLKQTPQELFDAWREKNGIGDEVKLLEFYTKDNSTTTVQGNVASHTVGDYFILNVKVSKNIADYHGTMDEALLLQSLKQTLTGYMALEFDEYYLTLG